MNSLFTFGPEDYLAFLPPLLMVLFGCATLLIDAVGGADSQSAASRLLGTHAPATTNPTSRWLISFNALGLLFIGYSLFRQWQALSFSGASHIAAFQDSIIIDGLSLFINAVVWIAVAMLLLLSYRYLEIAHEHRGEYYCLALFAQCGMYFMASGIDLVALFLGIELTAISFYILVGFTRANRLSNEAALKYLLLGALSSGFLLYGFSLLYGISSSTNLSQIAAHAAQRGAFDPFVLLATVTVTVGLLFKISAVPFHSWTPDAYDGAPTPVTAFLSVASKVASFGVLVRLLWITLPSSAPVWKPILIVTAVLSLTVGSIAALTQGRVKRLFAYSAIAHAGYVLLGFVAGTSLGLEAVYIYLLVYALMNLGAFAVLISLRRHGIAGENVTDLRGLSHTYPIHAALFAVLLLSLGGIPPTAGFIAKYFIFAALIRTGHITLAVLAALYIPVSIYFYFRLVREMYLFNAETREPLADSLGIRVALFATTAFTLIVGFFPEPVLRATFPLAGIPQ